MLKILAALFGKKNFPGPTGISARRSKMGIGLWLILLPILCLLISIVLISLIPIFLGQEPAIRFSLIERDLSILNQDLSAQIIVGGDSRSKNNVIPSIITQETNRKCINIAQPLTQGGDISSLVKVLKKHPKYLTTHPILLLSINLESFNDLGYSGTPPASLLSWTLWDHLRVASRRPKSYPVYFLHEYLPAVKILLLKKWNDDRFPSVDSLYQPISLLASQGYIPLGGRQVDQDVYLWPKELNRYLLNGARWKAFQAALEWLSQSSAQSIILYSAPMDTGRVIRIAGPEPLKIPGLLSEIITKEVVKYPKITFLDLYPNGVPGLIPEMDFYDLAHLNYHGSEVFSHFMGKFLSRRLSQRTP